MAFLLRRSSWGDPQQERFHGKLWLKFGLDLGKTGEGEMKRLLGTVLIGAGLVITGCSTSTTLKLPPNTQVRINHKPDPFVSGHAEMRPFFWNSAAGVRYVITNVNDGSVVRKGKLPTRFRVASIFWPPYALIYWPLGFACESYDLTKGEDDLYCY